MTDSCEHFSEIRPVEPSADGCEDCIRIGAKWTQLRVCLTCGHAACCEDSPHAHALAHFNATGHPMISSLERFFMIRGFTMIAEIVVGEFTSLSGY